MSKYMNRGEKPRRCNSVFTAVTGPKCFRNFLLSSEHVIVVSPDLTRASWKNSMVMVVFKMSL